MTKTLGDLRAAHPDAMLLNETRLDNRPLTTMLKIVVGGLLLMLGSCQAQPILGDFGAVPMMAGVFIAILSPVSIFVTKDLRTRFVRLLVPGPHGVTIWESPPSPKFEPFTDETPMSNVALLVGNPASHAIEVRETPQEHLPPTYKGAKGPLDQRDFITSIEGRVIVISQTCLKTDDASAQLYDLRKFLGGVKLPSPTASAPERDL